MARWRLELASSNKAELRAFLVLSESPGLSNTAFSCKKQSKLGACWTLGIIAACRDCGRCNPCRSLVDADVPSCGEQRDASLPQPQL